MQPETNPVRLVVSCVVCAGAALALSGCGDGASEDGAPSTSSQPEQSTPAIPESTSSIDPVLAGSSPAETPTSTPQQAQPAADRETPWVVPEGWELDPGQRPMRVATYLAPVEGGTVEVAITRFGGTVGGELANVNRWRGQMGLAPVEQSGLEDVIERFSTSGFSGYQTRVDGGSGAMIVAGVYDESINQTWFVRATVGSAAQADALEADVFGMARSIAGME